MNLSFLCLSLCHAGRRLSDILIRVNAIVPDVLMHLLLDTASSFELFLPLLSCSHNGTDFGQPLDYFQILPINFLV